MKIYSILLLTVLFSGFSLAESVKVVGKDSSRSKKHGKGGLADSALIDQMIHKQLKANDEKPNRPASDEVFVRRVYLDIIGRIPTKKETLQFLDSQDVNKKNELIDDLLDSDGYVSHYYHFWADLLRLRTKLNGNGQSRSAGLAYERWIKNSLRENKPYDDMVRELLTAEGRSWDNGAVGYYLRDYGMPLDNLAITTQVFLGTQVVCAQCHDHPFDEWTQMDYYHLAAFTYGIQTTNRSRNQSSALRLIVNGRKKKNKAPMNSEQKKNLNRAFSEILKPLRFNTVQISNRDLKLPKDYQYKDAKPNQIVKPKTLMGRDAVISEATSSVEAFAEWMTSSDNPRFTKVISNRLWKNAFGIGIIDPVDDLKETTAVSNPELMAFLEKKMRDFDYDTKRFLKVIFNTKAYQREASLKEITPGMPYHFAGPLLRRMSAEQIWDSVVAMVVPEPDKPSRAHELYIDQRLTRLQVIAESVYDQKPTEFLKSANSILALQKELSAKIEAAQTDLAGAREKGDQAGINEANKKVRGIRQELLKGVEDKVFRSGLSNKLQLVAMNDSGPKNGEQTQTSQFFNDLAAALTAEGTGPDMEEFAADEEGVIDKIAEIMMAEENAKYNEWRDNKKAKEMKAWKVKTPDDKRIYKAFVRNQVGSMHRSSEIESPAPGNHFLRAFGQSDRELVENANDEASITQALTMLNGPIRNSITNRYSVLFRDLKGESFQDRLETVYLTMYSRKPSPEELQIFRDSWKANPESGTLPGIVWTILNTKQFLFIQ